jgi:integrase
VAEGLLDTNVAAGVKAPAVPHAEARFLTPDELVRLEAAMDGWWGLVVPFLADTGLRLGELAGLRVEDVDVLRGRVRVVRTVVYVTKAVSGSNARRQLHEPKTGAGWRMVPTLTRTTGERVAALIRERGLGPGDCLFRGKRGAPMDPAVWRARVWRPAVRKAELAEPLPAPHALRHTAVALWIAAGVTEPLKLARWAGHRSISVTYGTYGHLLPDDADPTRDALERIRSSATQPSEGQIRRLG